MPKYKFYDVSQPIEEAFRFLINDYGYQMEKSEQDNMGFTIVYTKDERKVRLFYDYRDNSFYFYVIKGKDTPYPGDEDKNILSFYHLFQHYESGIDLDRLEPNEEQYQEALLLNAQLLRKYGDKLLKGEDWLEV